jgi:transcriptional regulator GlxA family with amidase domain
LLDGKRATIHHGAYVSFKYDFPAVTLVKDRRYVQSDPVVFTSGGLSSGIDLALRVVELHFGREVADRTARTWNMKEKDGREMEAPREPGHPLRKFILRTI